MKINLKNRQLINLIRGIVFFNLLFLAGTYIFNYYFFKIQNSNWQNGSNIKYVLMEFSLALENVLATWYSSMLLLSVAIIFFICYLLQKKDNSKKNNKNLSYGWLIFAGIFTLLSLDEMASLHERLGNISTINLMPDFASGWVALLAIPIALVASFMIWFCLLQIKRAPLAALFAVMGILLFGSIPLQEYFEMNAWQAAYYSDAWQRPVGFLLLEEGSELFGATFMMVSGLLSAYSLSLGKKYSPGSPLKLWIKLNNRKSVFQYTAGFVFLVLLMMALLNNELLNLDGEITDLGKRENWFPASSAFLSFLLCLYIYFKDTHTNFSNIFFYLSIFSLIISAYYGANINTYMFSPMESIFKISIIAFFTITTLVLTVKMFFSIINPYTRVAILSWACLLIPAFVIFSWHSAALIFIGFSILSISLIHRITSAVPKVAGISVTEKHRG